MKIYQTRLVQDEDMVRVECNMCGKSLDIPADEPERTKQSHQFADFYTNFGCYSEFYGKYFSFDLCPDCFRKLLASFVIPAERGEM